MEKTQTISAGILAASATALVMLGTATPASAQVLAEYNYNTFATNVGNPDAPDSANTAGVTVSDLTRDPGGVTGNMDGLGTITADETRDNTPDTFSSTALAIGVGTVGRNPFGTPAEDILSSQDFLAFTLTADVDGVDLSTFDFDYGASVATGDQTGLLSAAQLFANVNGAGFAAVGSRQDRTVPGDAPGVFTGFIPASVDLSSLSTLNTGDIVEFRLSFGDNSGASTSQKGVYVDNFTLNGSVPEPASLSLLGVGGLALLRRRRA